MPDNPQPNMSRRTALKTGTIGLAAFLAGCGSSGDDSTETGNGGNQTDTVNGDSGTSGGNQTDTVDDDSGTPENSGQQASHPPTPERLRTHLESVPQPQNAIDAYDPERRDKETLLTEMRIQTANNFASPAVARNILNDENYSIVKNSKWIESAFTSDYGEIPDEMAVDHFLDFNGTVMAVTNATEEDILSHLTNRHDINNEQGDETYGDGDWSIWNPGYDTTCTALNENKIIRGWSENFISGDKVRSDSGQKVKDKIDVIEGREDSFLEAPSGLGEQLNNVIQALEETDRGGEVASVQIYPGFEQAQTQPPDDDTFMDVIYFFQDGTTSTYEVEVLENGNNEWTEDLPRRPIREGQDLT